MPQCANKESIVSCRNVSQNQLLETVEVVGALRYDYRTCFARRACRIVSAGPYIEVSQTEHSTFAVSIKLANCKRNFVTWPDFLIRKIRKHYGAFKVQINGF